MVGLIPRDHWGHNVRDLFQGFAAILNFTKSRSLIHIPGLGDCLPVRSGRSGLFIAIKALDLPPGSKVRVPLYCCHVVFEAIMAAGYSPFFIDIDPETFCLSVKDLYLKRSQIEAVVAVHMFGNLCNIPALQAAAMDRPIIEDCAQAIGSKLNGRLAGSFGKIAFFSFRSGKYHSVGEGGALFSQETDVCDRMTRLICEMPPPSFKAECIHLAKTYIKSVLRSRPLYGPVGYPLWGNYNKKVNPSGRSNAFISKILRADLAVIRKRMGKIDAEIQRQRANADYYSSTLKLAPNMLCSEKSDKFYNRYHYPITFASSEHRDLIATYLLKRKFDTIKYMDNVVDIATQQYEYREGCLVAEKLSKRVLIIPSYHSLKKKDVKRIARCVNAGWVKIGRKI